MKSILLAAVAATTYAAVPASAAIVNISVNGTIGFGIDSLGLFSPIGTNLSGAAYRMDFAYDLANAVDAGQSRQANGGTFFNRPSPIRRGDISINGTSVSAIDPYSATYARFFYPTFSELDFGTGGPNGINAANFSWSRQDQSIPLALDAPIARTFGVEDTVYSAFQRANTQLTVFTYLSLRPTNLTVAIAQAVPEPGSWMMMIAGFGLVGATARRRPRLCSPS